MRFLLQNSIMTARSPPDLLDAATVMALQVQNASAETIQKNRLQSDVHTQFSHISKVKDPNTHYKLVPKLIPVSRQYTRLSHNSADCFRYF